MKKRLTAIVLMLAFFTSTSLAAGYQKSIIADFDVKLTIDGQAVSLADAAGNAVQPFTYNGTTYVPIRAVADYLGAGVHYNSSTKTANVSIDAQDAALLVYYIRDSAAQLYTFCEQIQLDLALGEYHTSDRYKRYNAEVENYNRIADMYNNSIDAGNQFIPQASMNSYITLIEECKTVLGRYDDYAHTTENQYYNQLINKLKEVIETYYTLCNNTLEDMLDICK